MVSEILMEFSNGIALRSSIKNQLTQSKSALNVGLYGQRTMMIPCILTELLQCKIHEKCLCQYLLGSLRYNKPVRLLDHFSSTVTALFSLTKLMV